MNTPVVARGPPGLLDVGLGQLPTPDGPRDPVHSGGPAERSADRRPALLRVDAREQLGAARAAVDRVDAVGCVRPAVAVVVLVQQVAGAVRVRVQRGRRRVQRVRLASRLGRVAPAVAVVVLVRAVRQYAPPSACDGASPVARVGGSRRSRRRRLPSRRPRYARPKSASRAMAPRLVSNVVDSAGRDAVGAAVGGPRPSVAPPVWVAPQSSGLQRIGPGCVPCLRGTPQNGKKTPRRTWPMPCVRSSPSRDTQCTEPPASRNRPNAGRGR